MSLIPPSPLAREPGTANRVSRRVALQHQPLPAAEHVLPVLPVRALWVVEQEHVVVPGLTSPVRVGRARLGRIAAVTELGVVALAAVGAGYPEHGATACRSSCPGRTRRMPLPRSKRSRA